jgi:hypothetical protein
VKISRDSPGSSRVNHQICCPWLVFLNFKRILIVGNLYCREIEVIVIAGLLNCRRVKIIGCVLFFWVRNYFGVIEFDRSTSTFIRIT